MKDITTVMFILRDLEEAMADIGQSLKIKYGLRDRATPEQIRRWEALVRQYLDRGVPPEDAGRAAAKDVFPDFQKYFYKSEADTLEALLRELGK